MKQIIFSLLLMSLGAILSAQSVGIGTTIPDSSALLELKSTSKGILIPRMTTAQRDSIVDPAIGLQIINLDDFCVDIYDGVNWIKNCGMRQVGQDTVSEDWIRKADFGGSGRGNAIGFSINGKGYLGTGNIFYETVKDFWAYDPSTNTWMQKADVGGMTRGGATAFVINGKGYVGLGFSNGFGNLNDFWEYDPLSNSWTQKPGLPATGRNRAVGLSLQNEGYVIAGGNDVMLFKEVWRFNPSQNSWNAAEDFPYPVTSAFGFSVNEKGYVGTGMIDFDNFYHTNSFYEYNPVTNMWTQRADFAGGERMDAIGFSIGNSGYAGTGYSFNNGTRDDMWSYDPGTNAWMMISDFEGGARRYAVGFSIENKGYVGTGHQQLKDFWAYTPSFIGKNYQTALPETSPYAMNDGIWKKQGESIMPLEYADIVSPGNLSINGNGKIGIGILSPNAPLQFATEIRSKKLVLWDGNNNESEFYGFGVNANVLRYQTDDVLSDHVFYAASSPQSSIELMRIKGDGNVGIGAQAPANRLDIDSYFRLGTHPANRPLYVTGNLGAASTGIEFRIFDATQGIGFGYNTIYAAGSVDSQDLGMMAKGANGNLVFTTNDAERLRIKGNGNVGVGIDPTNTLDIHSGAARSGTHPTNLPMYVTGDIGSGSNGFEVRHNNGAEGIGLGYNTIYAAGENANQFLGLAAKGTGGLFFNTNNITRAWILGNGYMGIDVSPTNRLDIHTGVVRTGTHPTDLPLYVTNNNNAASNGVEFRNNNGQQGIGFGYNTIYATGSDVNQDLSLASRGSGGLILLTNGTERMRITGLGNVGIGTTSPNAPLQFSNTTGNRKIVMYEANNNEHEFFGFGVNVDGTMRYQTPVTVNDHVFYAATSATNSNELMRIKGNGRVGIGIAPTNQMDIHIGVARTGTHATGLPLYVTNNSNASSNGVEFRNNNGQQGIGFGYNTIYAAGSDANQDLGLASKGTGGLIINTNGVERMRIKGDGKVGVGVASPSNQMDIRAGAARTGTHPSNLPLYVTGDIGADTMGMEVRHNNGTQGIGIGYSTVYAAGSEASQNLGMSAKGPNGNLIFSTNDTARVIIQPDGDVNIAKKLEIGYIQIIGAWVDVLPLSGSFANCNCPPGTVVLGGGFNTNNTDVRIRDNGANGPSSWGVTGNNYSVINIYQIRATAICARLEN